MNENKYWVGFSLIPAIGQVKFSQLEKYFGNLENAWRANASELKAAGLDSKSVNTIVAKRPLISLDAEMEKLERYKIKVFTWNDSDYPSRLKEVYDRPPVLYLRGLLTEQDERAVAVVGTRRASAYGRQVAEEMATDLAQSDITIVSGLARGIDSIAHRAALAAGGRTIAVFGCGLDVVYPAEHVKLARDIMERGALISEYPLGTRPKAENFPRRNRIMSGMSLGVLVVEAGESSGAMITARLALEQDREVFAVPGSIFSQMSKGPNALIQEGAKLVRNHMDILEELNLSAVARQMEMKEPIPATDDESVILHCLSTEPIHIDDICHQASLPIATVSGLLAMMELKGMVKQVGGMNYVLSREAREEYELAR